MIVVASQIHWFNMLFKRYYYHHWRYPSVKLFFTHSSGRLLLPNVFTYRWQLLSLLDLESSCLPIFVLISLSTGTIKRWKSTTAFATFMIIKNWWLLHGLLLEGYLQTLLISIKCWPSCQRVTSSSLPETLSSSVSYSRALPAKMWTAVFPFHLLWNVWHYSPEVVPVNASNNLGRIQLLHAFE